MITIHKYKIVSKLLIPSFLRINLKINKNYTLVEYLKIEGEKTSVGHLYHNFSDIRQIYFSQNNLQNVSAIFF